MNGDSCEISDKGKSCCSSLSQKEEINIREHWDKTYSNGLEDKLGWYESDVSPSLTMIDKTELPKSAKILNVGSGSTTLIDQLLKSGYYNLLATDISKVSLDNLRTRLGNESNKVELIVDDLTNPILLSNIEPVDLWIDRAVLHFLTEPDDQITYFNLLKEKVSKDGFVIFAEYNLQGAEKCAGLPVHRYSKEMLSDKLGSDFRLVHNFDHIYTMPSGALRPYLYTLFKREVK